MIFSESFNSQKTTELFGLNKKFEFFKNLIQTNKIPKVLLLTGDKGIGKSTLVNHLMFFVFDKENYDLKKNKLLKKSFFYNQFTENMFPNILYLSGSNFQNVKVEDMRTLKDKLFKKSISIGKRFVILDDVETFNINSLNALLKIIEEPGENNFFILINNKSKSLLDTIKSRCNEIIMLLDENSRKQIIHLLTQKFNQKTSINTDLIKLSPGNFIKFNYMLNENNIDLQNKLFKNFKIILNLYKKDKNIFFKDLLLFLTDYYYQRTMSQNKFEKNELMKNRMILIKNINNFFLYNLSNNYLLNSAQHCLLNE